MNTVGLQSILKIGIATFLGAFFGALTLTAVPTTLDGWKSILAPALGAALAAEVMFLRKMITAFLASGGQLPAVASTDPVANAKAVAAKLLGVLACLVLLPGCLKVQSAAQQAEDFSGAVACVESNWGQPVPVVAGNCFNGIQAAAQDAIADVEALFEGQALAAGVDVGKIQAAFPYAGNSALAQIVLTKRSSHERKSVP